MKRTWLVASAGVAIVITACSRPGGATPSSVNGSIYPSASASPAMGSCTSSDPDTRGDIVSLYFPCGPGIELHPVQRAVTSVGEKLIAEVVRLFLAGPSAEERATGFDSLLSPGDMEIVEIASGRLVLDVPEEINNVSTSAGSRIVLGGLRETLLALDDIDEIELRLRNDCAAFFEWIQVGPTCHLLTADGLVHAPMPSPSAAAGVPTIPRSPTGPEITDGSPVADEDDDGTFRLTLEVGQDRYRAGQAIDAKATLTFLGPDDTVDALGPGTGLIGFGVESDDPAIRIGPAFTTDCAPWPFTRDKVVDYPFGKSGGFSADEPLAPFYRAYFDDPELRLPAGTWTIGAGGGFYSGSDCGPGFPLHELTVSVTVVVEP